LHEMSVFFPSPFAEARILTNGRAVNGRPGGILFNFGVNEQQNPLRRILVGSQCPGRYAIAVTLEGEVNDYLRVNTRSHSAPAFQPPGAHLAS
jgi:hypothetical protein